MKRNIQIALGVVVLIVGGAVAWFFSQGNAEPTAGVTAPPIAATTTAADGAAPETTAGPTDTTEASVVGAFEFTDESVATFTIDEVLRGDPQTVLGTSGIVLGQIQIDRADLSNSQVGEILVNARDFETDSSSRNRAIRGPILDADTFEFISFVPTSIDGLTGAATVGEELVFTIIGDLTIRDVTQEVAFDVSAILTSETTIEGTATTVVNRNDFELAIPSVAAVADVSEDVPLTLEFVAEAG